jgi:ABC-type metal ion transport system substrate-binding protein
MNWNKVEFYETKEESNQIIRKANNWKTQKLCIMEFLEGIDYNTAKMKLMKKSIDRALFQATVEDWPENKLS